MLQKPFLLLHIPHIYSYWTLLQVCANTGLKCLSNALPSFHWLPGTEMLHRMAAAILAGLGQGQSPCFPSALHCTHLGHAGKSLGLENVADSQVQSSPAGALCSWGQEETEEGISQILQESDYLSKAVVHRMMYKSTSPPLKGFASHEPGSAKKWERVKSPKGINQQRMLSCKVSS